MMAYFFYRHDMFFVDSRLFIKATFCIIYEFVVLVLGHVCVFFGAIIGADMVGFSCVTKQDHSAL